MAYASAQSLAQSVKRVGSAPAPQPWSRLPHLVGHHVAIDVHRRSDVAVPHQPLLNGDWRPDGIQSTAVGVPKGVSAEIPDSRFLGCPLKFAPKPRVALPLPQAAQNRPQIHL